MTNILVCLLIVHWVADFILQSDYMALNKSKNWEALILHCLVYAGPFMPVLLVLGQGIKAAACFMIFLFVTHFWVDAITSRITSKLWFFKRTDRLWVTYEAVYKDEDFDFSDELWLFEGGNRHWFFVVIGLDQLIHQLTIAAGIYLFLS